MSKLDSDDGGPDDAMCTQSEFWIPKPNARGMNTIDWSDAAQRKVPLLANGCILTWGANAGTLTIPPPVISTSDRGASKMYRLEDLMSDVCDPQQVHKHALNKAGKVVRPLHNYTQQSETFGGGIFNDPIVSSDLFLNNFEGLNRSHKEKYVLSRASDDQHMSVIWLICKLFDSAMDAYTGILNTSRPANTIPLKFNYSYSLSIESIRNNTGQFFCAKHNRAVKKDVGTAPDINRGVSPQSTFLRLFLLHEALHAGEGDRVFIQSCSDAELQVLCTNFNNRVTNQVTRVEKIEKVMRLLDLDPAGDYRSLFFNNAADALDDTCQTQCDQFNAATARQYGIYTAEFNQILERIYAPVHAEIQAAITASMGAGALAVNLNDNLKGYLQDTIHKQLQKIVQTVQAWSHSIYMQNSYNAISLQKQISCFKSKKQLSEHFDSILQLLKTDAVREIFQTLLVYDNRSVEFRSMPQTQKEPAEIFTNECFGIMQAFSNIANTQSLYQDFLADVHTNSEVGLMTLNVASMAQHDSVYTPNLHLSRCDPLKSSDCRQSATSADPRLWMIQQFAGMSPMTIEMCSVLLKDHPLVDNTLSFAYEQFLTSAATPPKPYVGSADEKCRYPYNTFLMHWYMQNFHPSASVRERAALKAVIPHESFASIACAIGQAIDHNTCNSMAFEHAIVSLPGYEYDGQTVQGPFCTATLASEYLCVTPFVNSKTYAQDGDDSIAAYRSWKDTPVIDLESGFLDFDASQRTKQECLNSMRVVSGLGPSPALDLFNAVSTATTSNNSRRFYNPLTRKEETMSTEHVMTDVLLPWLHRHRWDDKSLADRDFVFSSDKLRAIGLNSQIYSFDVRGDSKTNAKSTGCKHIYDENDSELLVHAHAASDFCRNPENVHSIMQHVLLVLANRFWKPAARFSDNGRGVPVINPYSVAQSTPTLHKVGNLLHCMPYTANPVRTDKVGLISLGMHFMHGVHLPTTNEAGSQSTATDIIILRPNIEHEMLGVIMGRGGTQELGATFWGQTELSCYDDAQHGIWGMSYKYHERAIVTNERNLIRVYDVAFDGYNGGMDQSALNWNSAHDRHRFRTATYARDRAYNGPSMLVMALPRNGLAAHRPFPNPIVFHPHVTGSVTPDSEKGQRCPDVNEHMVFNHTLNPDFVPQSVQDKYEMYMRRLEMNQWASIDQSITKRAGQV